MDIHKPKPWRGWPEFLKEIGTIVIGVLIALAAEQAVEWLHWRHLAEQDEADLAAGMRNNLVNAVELAAIDPCQRVRITELAAALQKPGPDWRANPMPIANPSAGPTSFRPSTGARAPCGRMRPGRRRSGRASSTTCRASASRATPTSTAWST